MNNIFVLDKNYNKIGTLSNQGVKPLAPYYNDLFVQELETGADTYEFSTISNSYTQDCIEIGNHIMFAYKNRNELFTITSLEYSHSEGYKTIGVYAEGLGFELLEIFMKKPDNNSGGGTDNDNDGDDNYDDEYADVDDIYIDANGNIIYDRDGSGLGDVTVDGNGNIIYKRSKNNRKNDSLEFKNISYPTFLNVLLKNTGWSFVCQPGLESIKHDITVRYDTNIYAILQDSMQDYRGVELEFVYEYNNGNVKKTVKAYKDGGRGSFVGKRFEYGTNVKGITKTQEVTNSEDDTILYVDNVGVDVRYDVDFALKSAEVPEIEIGDTHYVIDKEFHPPMTIKARIGKIEISFSDPTRNKIYLANNKKIRGSAIEEGVNEDDIKDIMDDYDGDIGEHTHSYLENYIYRVHLSGKELTGANRFYNLGSETFPWWYIFTRAMRAYGDITSPRYFGYNYQVFFDREDMEDVVKITNSSNVTKQDLLNFIVNDLNVYEYSSREVNESVNENVDDPNARFPNQLYFGLLSEDVVNHGNPCKTSAVGKRISKGLVQNDTNNDGDGNDNDVHNAHTYSIPALLAALIGAFQYYVSGGKPTGSNPKDEDYDYTGNPSAPSDPDDPGTGGGTPNNPGSGSYGKIICNELEVSGANGSAGIANIFGELYVTEEIKCELLIEANTLDASVIEGYQGTFNFLRVGDELDCDYMKCDCIVFPDGTTLTSAGDAGASVAYITNVTIDSKNHLIITLSNGKKIDAGALPSGGGSGDSGGSTSGGTLSGIPIEYIQQENSSMYLGTSWIDIDNDIHVKGNIVVDGISLVGGGDEGGLYLEGIAGIKFNDGSFMETAGVSGSSGSYSGPTTQSQYAIFKHTNSDTIETSLIQPTGGGDGSGTINIDGSIDVENSIRTHTLVVNNPDIIGATGMIILPDGITFPDGSNLTSAYGVSAASDLSEYATIEQLQEEIRTKDEQIANLEARLARIEAMLGINNDN